MVTLARRGTGREWFISRFYCGFLTETTKNPPAHVYDMSSPALPSPDERPHSDVVVFDGNCGICTRQVSKLPWWDCQQKLSYLSLHDPQVHERWPDMSHDRLMTEMCIVDTAGNRHWGAAAIRHLTRRLRRLWWASPFLHFPGSMFLWQPLYRWIAKNRYRLSGTKACENDACQLHR